MTLPRRLFCASLPIGCFLGLGSVAMAAKPTGLLALPDPFPKLLPLHTRLGPPQPGEWLAEHPEPGQTFQQYVRSQPVVPDKKRRVIYVQPLGDHAHQRDLSITADYMRLLVARPDQRRPAAFHPSLRRCIQLGHGPDPQHLHPRPRARRAAQRRHGQDASPRPTFCRRSMRTVFGRPRW